MKLLTNHAIRLVDSRFVPSRWRGIGDRASLAEEPGGNGGGRYNCFRFVAVLRDASDHGRSDHQVAAQRLYPHWTPAHRGRMESRVCS